MEANLSRIEVCDGEHGLFYQFARRIQNSLLTKIKRLARAAGLEKIVRKKGLTAVKVHFGERGNTAFIRPLLVRPVVDALLEAAPGRLSPTPGHFIPVHAAMRWTI